MRVLFTDAIFRKGNTNWGDHRSKFFKKKVLIIFSLTKVTPITASEISDENQFNHNITYKNKMRKASNNFGNLIQTNLSSNTFYEGDTRNYI